MLTIIFEDAIIYECLISGAWYVLLGVKRMTLEALKTADRVIGIKQVTKAINKGTAAQVFIADDADDRVTKPLLELCTEKKVEVVS